MRNIVLIIWCVSLSLCLGCRTKTEFFPLNELEVTGEKGMSKYIIVSNPPENLDSLAALVQKYSDTTIDICAFNRSKRYLKINFYRETRDLSRNYRESETQGGLSSEYIGKHTDDLIAVFQNHNYHSPHFKWELKTKEQNYPNYEWKEYPVEINCPE